MTEEQQKIIDDFRNQPMTLYHSSTDKITYSESCEFINEIGLKRWRKFNYETQPRIAETTDQAAKRAEQTVKGWLYGESIDTKPFGDMYTGYNPPPLSEILPEIQVDKKPKETWEQSMIEGINACTEIYGNDGVMSYSRAASQNLSVKEAYDKRLKELQV